MIINNMTTKKLVWKEQERHGDLSYHYSFSPFLGTYEIKPEEHVHEVDQKQSLEFIANIGNVIIGSYGDVDQAKQACQDDLDTRILNLLHPMGDIRVDDCVNRAMAVRDRVVPIWNPPLHTGNETPEQIAKTSTVLTLAFIFGEYFIKAETDVQKQAIIDGLKVYEKMLGENNGK